MKSFAGSRYTMKLEFAAGRTIFVTVDDDGLIYWANETDLTRRLLLDHWQATA